MAAENQDRRQHAAQHTGTAQHPEQRGEGPDALRAHGGQHPQLPEQRQQAGYRTENKHVAPADQLPEVAAERRGHHRGDRHRGKMIASAFGTWAAGTRRIAVAVDIAQKPPMAIPNSRRPSRRNASESAKATIRLETICSTERTSAPSGDRYCGWRWRSAGR